MARSDLWKLHQIAKVKFLCDLTFNHIELLLIMKKITASLIASILCLSVSFSQQQLLSNPSFENSGTFGAADADIWAEASSVLVDTVRFYLGPGAQDGGFVLATTATTDTGGGFPASTQTISITESDWGKEYSAALWAYAPNALASSTEARLKLEFVGGSASADTTIFGSGSATGTWLKGTISGTIPTNTTKIYFQVMYVKPGSASSGTMYFDSGSFTVIPESSTYATIFGLATLGLVVMRRRVYFL